MSQLKLAMVMVFRAVDGSIDDGRRSKKWAWEVRGEGREIPSLRGFQVCVRSSMGKSSDVTTKV